MKKIKNKELRNIQLKCKKNSKLIKNKSIEVSNLKYK